MTIQNEALITALLMAKKEKLVIYVLIMQLVNVFPNITVLQIKL